MEPKWDGFSLLVTIDLHGRMRADATATPSQSQSSTELATPRREC
ncbi:MAG TPA: hypothetical protein VFI54_18240 [Solirubrobacteraceae bacterium]|nr:hypothetical protein [Solirubrobacteraceae bacterium]